MNLKIKFILFVFVLISCKSKEDNINDFSAGMLVNVHPFETTKSEYDYLSKDKKLEIRIYVGKIKSNELHRFKNLDKNKYYLQLNDKIGDLNDVESFTICKHCEDRKFIIIIHADKNTPKEFLKKLEKNIFNYELIKNQIFYLTINLDKMTNGYNRLSYL